MREGEICRQQSRVGGAERAQVSRLPLLAGPAGRINSDWWGVVIRCHPSESQWRSSNSFSGRTGPAVSRCIV